MNLALETTKADDRFEIFTFAYFLERTYKDFKQVTVHAVLTPVEDTWLA